MYVTDIKISQTEALKVIPCLKSELNLHICVAGLSCPGYP